MVIATKFFGNLYPGDPNGGGGGRKAIVSACEQSLRRLRTDYIDLYWMHAWDRFTPIEESMRALDDLVRAGKVRYIGFSDTPAWKVAQAQLLAQMNSWTPLVALQIEYSLIERTVEGELMPMARELGLGVTPWSPLRGGVLSGKYTRDNAQTVKADRGDRVHAYLTDKNYLLIDELIAIAGELGTTAAAVALSWVQSRPGVASTIIGARRLDQLDQNLDALDVHLTQEQVARLDNLSVPSLNFPATFVAFATMFSHGGTTVNGEPSMPWPGAPKSDAERY
jgi:aryl-alcohol dehydrogenase-like predicted oxidoreductase